MPKYTVVGHLVIDRIVRDGREYRLLGGVAAYASIAAAKNNCHTNIISKVGEDFPDQYILLLARNNIDVSLVKRVSGFSTSYRLVYRDDGGRDIFLLSKCEDIFPKDIPNTFNSDIIHIGAVAGEIPLNTFLKICEKGCLRVLDVQGFIRGIDNGRIIYRKWVNMNVFLNNIDILHADIDEGRFITGENNAVNIVKKILKKYGVKIVLITLGRSGAYVGNKDSIYFIPSLVPDKIVDETGAGDVYTAVFSITYFNERDIVRAGCIAAGAVSFLVEEIGIYGIRPIDRCAGRAEKILEGVKKVF